MSPLICFLLLALTSINVNSEPPAQEKAALLSFITQTKHLNRIQWNATQNACTWTGVTCDTSQSTVTELRLPAVGLVGPIPPKTLGLLTNLRVLSLRLNRLLGPIPDDISNLTLLHSLYLQDNAIDGAFPDSLTSLSSLTKLDLADNSFSGEIPFSINNLKSLKVLYLDRNNFSGHLPSINISLTAFNVSNNKLNGSIPETLSKFPASSFAGNLQLCGAPLASCTPFFPAPSPSPSIPPAAVAKPSKKKLSAGAIVGIVVGAAVLLLILALLLFYCLKRRREGGASRNNAKAVASAPAAISGSREVGMTSSSKDDISGGVVSGERNRLAFVGSSGSVYSFDLEDLLRASAEVLGKGSVGTSYKAILEEGTTVVVKRLKDVAVTKREFEVHMEEIGKIEHKNLLNVRAYYYSKDEKLLVYDYLANGSLSAMLHGSRGSGRSPLDWDNRIRIALSAARGMSHLQTTSSTIHGNIKSSNILLQSDPDSAVLSDFSLYPLFSNATPPNRVAGYCAPEVMQTHKPTFKSDIYSFGVVLLELLTGKSPNQATLGDEGIDLPRWVQSVVREEWTAEVFDVELVRYGNVEEEMVQLLQLAMACVAIMPESRPEVSEVVRMMEEIASRGVTESDDTLDNKGANSGGPSPPAQATP